jgi:hypothetical protein
VAAESHEVAEERGFISTQKQRKKGEEEDETKHNGRRLKKTVAFGVAHQEIFPVGIRHH